jgi:predicted nucleotidyltransferase
MLNKLRKSLRSEKANKRIFDIILYGSATRNEQKYNDIDILVIFSEGDLEYRLDAVEKIKDKIKDKSVDIKQILLKELFSTAFLARTGVITEGISLFDGKRFAEKIGFNSYVMFYFTLKGLDHTSKIKFNYILSGRTTKGLIDQLKGKRMASGAVKIPVENAKIFKDALDANKIKYMHKNILEEI